MNWVDVFQSAVLGFLLWKGVKNETRVDDLEGRVKQ